MNFFTPKTIYMDHASASPLDENVIRKMYVFNREFANPSAIHSDGVRVRNALDEARSLVAKCLFAHPDEIIFTGSGTESNALAVVGVVRAYKGSNVPHIITTTIEHPAVLENFRMLEASGEAEVTYLPVNADGIVDLKHIRESLKDTTVLVSVMYANNEIGTIQPLPEIAKTIRHFKKNKSNKTLFPFFHTDACQAMNYLPVENIEKLGVDLLSFNSSKIYGPKGVGALYKKRGVSLVPLYSGGGQESGLRSGTESASLVVGLATALDIALKMKETESVRLTDLRQYAIDQLVSLSKESGYEIIFNGHPTERLPNNINISIKGISSELLVIELDAKGVRVSERSACDSDSDSGSHVIRAIRQAQGELFDLSDGSLRISFGRVTKKKDIDYLVNALFLILKKYKKYIRT